MKTVGELLTEKRKLSRKADYIIRKELDVIEEKHGIVFSSYDYESTTEGYLEWKAANEAVIST